MVDDMIFVSISIYCNLILPDLMFPSAFNKAHQPRKSTVRCQKQTEHHTGECHQDATLATLVKKSLNDLLQESGRKYAKQMTTMKKIVGRVGVTIDDAGRSSSNVKSKE